MSRRVLWTLLVFLVAQVTPLWGTVEPHAVVVLAEESGEIRWRPGTGGKTPTTGSTGLLEELQQMQSEAAKNPNRPSIGELTREVEQMQRDRDRKRMVASWSLLSLACNVLLAGAVAFLVWRRAPRSASQAKPSGGVGVNTES